MNIFEIKSEDIELYRNKEFLDVNAMLVIKHGDRPYLISKNKDKCSDLKIYIDYVNLEDILLSNVGCLVGGDEIYYDEVLLNGIVKFDSINKEFIFSDISKFLLLRDEIINVLNLRL